MKPRRLRKLFHRVLVVLLCLAFLAQSSPLLAMSYERRENSIAVQGETAAPQEVEQREARLSAGIVRVKPFTGAASKPATSGETAAAWPEMRPNFTAKGAPIEANVTQAPTWSVDETALLTGWNLVSLPKIPPDSDPSAVLSGILGQTEVVFAYDGCQPANPWQVYDPAAPPTTNDLTAVNQTTGFWLQANSAATLTFAGTLPPTTTIELCTGWNLIAMPAGQARPVRNALFSIEGKYSRVFGYEPEDAADPWTIYDITAPDWANDLKMMEPGRGYWVLATENTTMTLANEGEPPVARLLSPDELATEITAVTFITDVIGTAYSGLLESWTLSYRSESGAEWQTFATGATPILTDTLDQFDPTLLLNGLYEMELAVTDYEGITALSYADVVVDGNAKIGHFSLSFTDLKLPLAGVPIEVIRTYDSRDKEVGDFGVGWQLSLTDITLEKTHPIGDGWESALGNVSQNPVLPFFDYCLPPTLPHVVSISFPDDVVFQFAPTISPECQLLIPHTIVDITYEPLPGTVGTLEPLDQSGSNLLVVGGNPAPPLDLGDGPLGSYDPVPNQFWNQDNVDLHDPKLFKLTLPDGRSFIMSQDGGIQSITDLNNNTLVFSESGITHSSGTGLTFERDELERIVKITDPMSNTVNYLYDDAGDLVQVVNQVGYTTTFTYQDNHHLLAIVDPSGVQATRNEYDEDGRIIRMIDPEGNVVSFEHDLNGRREVIINALGHETTKYYDLQGQIITVTNALGDTSLFTYDDDGHMLTETDPLGNVTTHTYDEDGNMLTQTDALQNTITRTFNAFKQVLTHTDTNGAVTSFTYDDRGNLLTLRDPLGNVITNTYDINGNLTQTIDQSGNINTFTYNAFGNIIEQVNALGHTTVSTYDANQNELSSAIVRTDGQGITHTVMSEWEYDALNRVTNVFESGVETFRVVYTPIGQLSLTVQNGYQIERTYDSRGNLIRTTFPDGTEEVSTYNEANQRISFKDRNGLITTYEYDPLKRLTRINHSDGSFETTEYSPAGWPSAVVDANGNRTSFVTDALGRTVKEIDALGNEIQFLYDANWNLIQITDPLSNTVQYEFDLADRPIKTIFADGTFEQTFYDQLGNISQIVDQAGITTTFNYNVLGQLTTVIDPIGNETSFTYDELGNLLTQTDSRANTTKWRYDDQGRIISRTLPLGMTESFVYDVNGNLINQTDFNSQTITFTYDVNNQVTGKFFPDGNSMQYAYTPYGSLTVVTDTLGVTSFSYDNRSRLVGVVNPDGSTFGYTYDAVGNRLSLSLPSGVTTYGYDPLNRLRVVTDTTGITSYNYNSVGGLANVTYPNGSMAQFSFDTLQRLIKIENLRSDSTIISSYDYTLDAVGNRLSVLEDNGRSLNYTYDDLYRLVEESVTDLSLGNSVISYTYDSVGNLITKTTSLDTVTYQYDDNDRLIQVGGTTYQYDANGNMTHQNSLTETIIFEYDFENHLATVSAADNTISYTYDYDGLRVEANYDGVIVNYLVDKNQSLPQVVEERDGDSNLIGRYVYGLDLISHSHIGGTQYHFYDGLGSTRALIDNSETILATFTYGAYGDLVGSTGFAQTNYLFAGEQYDSHLDAYYLRARYYSQEIGRFYTMDTFSGYSQAPLTLNKYLYADANPINKVDPSGYAAMLAELQFVAANDNYVKATPALTLIQGGASAAGAGVAAGAGTTVGTGVGAASAAATTSLAKVTGIVATGILIKAGLAASAITILAMRSCAVRAVVSGVTAIGSGNPCDITNWNIFLPGQDTPDTTQHIRDAITMNPEWVYLIRGQKAHPRKWLQSSPTCKANYGTWSGLQCDEYPFASTIQGGQANNASLRLVPGWDNMRNGTWLGIFYGLCRVSKTNVLRGRFFVFPFSPLPQTGWTCK